MKVFISHTSAYEFWKQTTLLPSGDVAMPKEMPYVTNAAVEQIYNHGFNRQSRISITVSKPNVKSKNKNVKFHVNQKAPTRNKYIKLDENVAISSPETCFYELAGILTKTQLIYAAYTLCGNFAICKGELKERPCVTDVKRIKRYLLTIKDSKRRAKALSALRYVSDGSRSPMESFAAMAFCIPRKLGGYRIELPKMNYRIEAGSKSMVMRKFFLCDLYWPRARVAVEYDSNDFHFSSEKLQLDAARRSGLALCKVQTLVLTSRQLFSLGFFDECARALGASLGKRIPANVHKFICSRHDLLDFFRIELANNFGSHPSPDDRPPHGHGHYRSA